MPKNVRHEVRRLTSGDAFMERTEVDIVRGTLDLLILKSLSWGAMHGLAVLRWIEQTTRDQLQIEEGALYPALHRMEDKGWLEAEWGYTERNRKAKFYRLSARGRKQLTAELTRWDRYTAVVGLIVNAKSGGRA
jgi:PadR family transcriptional regulator PadR